MYCPVDGDEFVEGITHCPEHDVDLVEEPPELEESISRLADYLNEQALLRWARVALLISAVIYALGGVVSSTLYGLAQVQDEPIFTSLNIASSVQGAARPVALAALGVIAGTVLLRVYAHVTAGGSQDGTRQPPPPTDGMTRLLYTLLIAFTLVWGVTGVVTARDEAQQQLAPAIFGSSDEEPDRTFVLLTALHYAAYSGGASCLVIMGGRLMVQWHRRLRREV